MPDYSKGKIYKIFPVCEHDEGDIYIGSTTRPLSERMNRHRNDFKKNIVCCSSKILFDKYGLSNCKIVLIEEYSCDNKEQLKRKEGEFQQLQKCVNRCVAGRTRQEYEQFRKETKKEYYQINKQHILTRQKAYLSSDSNKEKRQLYMKEYNKNYKLRTEAYVLNLDD